MKGEGVKEWVTERENREISSKVFGKGENRWKYKQLGRELH